MASDRAMFSHNFIGLFAKSRHVCMDTCVLISTHMYIYTQKIRKSTGVNKSYL